MNGTRTRVCEICQTHWTCPAKFDKCLAMGFDLARHSKRPAKDWKFARQIVWHKIKAGSTFVAKFA